MKISEKVAGIYDRLDGEPLNPVWISLVPREKALARAHEVENSSLLALAGMTFAVKDNIDVAGMPTTAGCPAYAYTPASSATVVQRLVDAGAILIGKTNMDQFATGLVGTRSPFGACSSVYDERYISGGSSSGSAVAVAKGHVTFALGTDTAGSGRVPVAFNNLIGLKPTRGLLSTTGVVPACRTLDCVSILASNCLDAHKVWNAAKGPDSRDPFSREPRIGEDAAPWLNAPFRFGVPRTEQLEFFGDEEATALYAKAVGRIEQIGGQKVEIDFSVFRSAADLLYEGPWVAERLAAIQSFVQNHSAEMNPVVRGIIAGGNRFTAVDAFQAEYRLLDLCCAALSQWSTMDVLVLPTTGTIYTHEQVAADPVKMNSNLGYYTNFVNLMILAAVAAPAGFRLNGLPFGISFIGPAFSDEALLALAHRYLGGKAPLLERIPGCVNLAVVGAHLSGQLLNSQLTRRGARLKKTCRTAPGYRLYALAGGNPPKPGLARDDEFQGPGIEVEVWTIPEDQFGSFTAGVPKPLGIGNVTLDSGESVKGFICEPYALTGSTEITQFGGWRVYLASSKK
jgi:allophanate hydrolase